jgi:hypothetical protein
VEKYSNELYGSTINYVVKPEDKITVLPIVEHTYIKTSARKKKEVVVFRLFSSAAELKMYQDEILEAYSKELEVDERNTFGSVVYRNGDLTRLKEDVTSKVLSVPEYKDREVVVLYSAYKENQLITLDLLWSSNFNPKELN